MPKGPHISQWIKSKLLLELLCDTEKGSLLCFAKGHMSQTFVWSRVIAESICLREWNLELDTCPNLQCHISKCLWIEDKARGAELNWNELQVLACDEAGIRW